MGKNESAPANFICTHCGTDMKKTGFARKMRRIEWDIYKFEASGEVYIDDTNTVDADCIATECSKCEGQLTAEQIEEIDNLY